MHVCSPEEVPVYHIAILLPGINDPAISSPLKCWLRKLGGST